MINFSYKGFHGCESICGIDIYPINEYIVVVATELVENMGTSITNAFETLCANVVKHFGISIEKVIWIEHYLIDTLPDAGIKQDDDTWGFISAEMGRDDKIDGSKTSFEDLTQEDVDEILDDDSEFGLAELVVIRDN